jgi:hypothetical protein
MTDQEKNEIEDWLKLRKEAAKDIDPETAEVMFGYAQDGDPYGVDPHLPLDSVGRVYFARAPGSDIWVWFGDLPEATEEVLWDKHKRKLAFPAGVPCDPLWPGNLEAPLPNTGPRVE